MGDFWKCHAVTSKWEGGKVDHPDDPGGRTNLGITQAVYDGWRLRKGLSKQDVYRITPDEAKAIYRPQYWDVIKGDELPPGIDLAIYDFAVNSGPSRAVKFAQEVCRVLLPGIDLRVDGQLGEATRSALVMIAKQDKADDFIREIFRRRLAFMQRLRTWPTFGKGWTNRLNDVRPKALTMSAASSAGWPDRPTAPPIEPPDEPVVPRTPVEPTPKADEGDTKVTETPAGKESVKQTGISLTAILAWISAQVQAIVDALAGFTGLAPETVSGIMKWLTLILITIAVITALRKLYVIWRGRGERVPLEEV